MYGGLILLIVVGLIIYSLTQARKGSGHGITLDQIKRNAVVVALSVLVTIFIIFFSHSLGENSKDTVVFVTGSVMSMVALGAGYGARRNAVVSNGLIIGGFISLVYLVAENFYVFSPEIKTAVVGCALLLLTLFAYWYGAQRDALVPERSLLHGFKAFVIGSLIVLFAVLFIVNVDATINPAPHYPYVPYPQAPARYYEYQGQQSYQKDTGSYYGTSSPAASSPTFSAAEVQSFKQYESDTEAYSSENNAARNKYEQEKDEQESRSAYIIVLLAFAYLAVGLLVHAVPTVSIAYIVAGVGGIIVVFFESFDRLGKTAVTALSGIGIVALVAFAYWKFGNEPHGGSIKNDLSNQQPPTA